MMDNYQFDVKDNVAVFRTTHFRAEKGSVLHSGIYNRELTSSLAAGATLALAGFFFAGRIKITVLIFFAAIGCFVVLFLLFRRFIFWEPFLEAVFDRDADKISISNHSFTGTKKTVRPLGDLADIRKGNVSVSVENPDGVRMVEKIALQHFTVIPGFGQTAEFGTVELVLKNGEDFLIYSSQEPEASDNLIIKLRNFIER